MTWIRVTCSNGTRYRAPSSATPPILEGFDTLFASHEVGLRGLHSFPVRQRGSRTPYSLPSDEDEDAWCGERVSVLFHQVSLGGPLGTACIAAGSATDGAGHSELSVLLAYAEAVLRTTNAAGVRVLLDAVCTLAPTPAIPGSEVLEDDGLDRAGEQGGRYKNRTYLNQIRSTPAEAEEASEGGSPGATLSTTSLGGSSSFVDGMLGGTPMTRASPTAIFSSSSPSSQAALARAGASSCSADAACLRRARLHFLRLRAVPLSLLYGEVHVTHTTTAGKGRPRRTHSRGGIGADEPSYTSAVRSCLPQRAADASIFGGKPDAAQRHWHPLASAASDDVTALLRVVQSTLAGLAPPGSEELIAYGLWQRQGSSPSPSPAPAQSSAIAAAVPDGAFVAAFSTRGVLLASPQWWTRLPATTRVLLSAAAMDAMSSVSSHAAAPWSTTTTSAALLRTTSLPIQLPPTPTARADPKSDEGPVVEVGILTVGTALAVLFGLPRAAPATHSTAAASPSQQPQPPSPALPHVDSFAKYISRVQRSALECLSSPDTSIHAGVLGDVVCALTGSGAVPHTPETTRALFSITSQSERDFVRTGVGRWQAVPPSSRAGEAVYTSPGSFLTAAVAPGQPTAGAVSVSAPAAPPAGGSGPTAPLPPPAPQPLGAPGQGCTLPLCLSLPSSRRASRVSAGEGAGARPSTASGPTFSSPAGARRKDSGVAVGSPARVDARASLDGLAPAGGPSPRPPWEGEAVEVFLRWCHVAARVAEREAGVARMVADTPVEKLTWVWERPRVRGPGEPDTDADRCVVSITAPPVQTTHAVAGGSCRGALRDFTPLEVLMTDPSATRAEASSTALLPASMLDPPGTLARRASGVDASSETDSSSDCGAGDDADEDVAMLTCLTYTAAGPASRRGASLSKVGLLCLSGTYLDGARVLHQCMARPGSLPKVRASGSFSQEREVELVSVCEAVGHLTRASESIAESVFIGSG